MGDDREHLLRRLAAREWLRPGQVAEILEVHRKTVHNMLVDGRLGWRVTTTGRQRLVDPGDVQRMLDAAAETRRRGRLKDSTDEAPPAP